MQLHHLADHNLERETLLGKNKKILKIVLYCIVALNNKIENHKDLEM